ncbi:MAG: hypothetical protein WAN20_23890 [Pseudonocardiaceae bacterium]|jgi:hypothetical protein|nr:hypothetical protein [Pseudonocardiaceae bacterium]
MATVRLRIWLDTVTRALLTNDVRRREKQRAETRGLRAVGRGVAAGLAEAWCSPR